MQRTAGQLHQDAADAPNVAGEGPAQAQDDLRGPVVPRGHHTAVIVGVKRGAAEVDNLDLAALGPAPAYPAPCSRPSCQLVWIDPRKIHPWWHNASPSLPVLRHVAVPDMWLAKGSKKRSFCVTAQDIAHAFTRGATSESLEQAAKAEGGLHQAFELHTGHCAGALIVQSAVHPRWRGARMSLGLMGGIQGSAHKRMYISKQSRTPGAL